MRNSRKIILASSALALLFSAAAANAQTAVTQGDTTTVGPVVNGGNILNQGSITVTTGGISGFGASVSIGATGAVASTGVSIITGAPQTPAAFSSINQEVFNSGGIVNRSTGLGLAAGSSLSDGASIASSAIGSAASFSQLGNNVKILDIQSVDRLEQTVENDGAVSNTTVSTLRGVALSGNGASVSFGATGAAASISATLIEGKRNNARDVPLGFEVRFETDQNADNSGAVRNLLQNNVNVGGLIGTGASVSVAATGAAVSSSTVSLNGGNVGQFIPSGGARQKAWNFGTVTNNALDKKVIAGGISGNGAAVQISASGASASFGSSVVNAAARSNFNSTVALIGLDQDTINFGSVSNMGTVNSGDISGHGASTQVSALGASTALSVVSINGGGAEVSFQGNGSRVSQLAENRGTVRNVGATSTGVLSGTGASSQISAVGASTSLNATSMKGIGAFIFGGDNIFQLATNFQSVRNAGGISSGELIGNGSSVQIAAIGASSTTALSSLDGGLVNLSNNSVSRLSVADNSGEIINSGTGGKPNSIKISGDLSGLASSASISAVGASASFSLSSVAASTISGITPAIDHNVRNEPGPGTFGGVLNRGNISAGSLTGTGSSIQVAAVGASSSVAVSSIAPSTTSFGTISLGLVNQSRIINSSPVTNIGVVSAGMVSGVASSIGISATGASASVSFVSIAGK